MDELIITNIIPQALEILKLSIPSIFTVIVFILGTKVDISKSRHNQLKTQFEELYIPFRKYWIIYNLEITPLSKLTREQQDEIMEFLLDHVYLMETRCQELFVRVYQIYLTHPDPVKHSDHYTVDTYNEMIADFDDFACAMQDEYSHICSRLKYPRPPKRSLPYL